MEKKQGIKTAGNKKDSIDHRYFFSDRVVDKSRSMVSIINSNYIYENVNLRFCSAHGSTRKTFIGKSLSDIWGYDTFRNKIKNNIDLCFKGNTVKYKAGFFIPKSGKHRYFEVIFRPVRTGNGEIKHLIAETFDITDLRESKIASGNLKKKFRKKELSLENRLLQAQRLETIGIFAGGIAHDFNNILATVSGHAEMLQDDLSLRPDMKEKAGKILEAVGKARSLTNQILAFSRSVDKEKIIVNVNEVLKETVGFIKSVIPKGVSLKTDYTERDMALLADPDQLFRTFLNLATNAIQSMEGDGGTLSISTKVIRSDKKNALVKNDIISDAYAVIRFEDTGSGMDDVTKLRLFEPFYTTREIGKGTGLGLWVVYGIVSDLEGEILVSSKKNIGSVFDVCLPVFNITPLNEKGNGLKKKILFIKDKKYTFSILSKELENSGYDLMFVSDRKHFEKVLADNLYQPDLLIYMNNSGRISGKVFNMIVREYQLKIPCILITGSNDERIEEELVNSGIVIKKLMKPVTLNELQNSIRSIMV